MKIDVPDEFLPRVIRALDHYEAYLHAVQREDHLYRAAADFFREMEKKGPGREEATAEKKKRKA